jgi:uncharacterized protein YbgA (DUF1722 family)
MNPMIKTESRDSLLFGEYRYCAKFYGSRVAGIRRLSHKIADRYVDYQYTADRVINPGGSWKGSYNISRDRSDVIKQQKQNLYALVDFFVGLENKYKLIVSGDFGYFYTNNFDDIEQLKKHNFLDIKSVKRIAVDLPPNSMRIQNAKHDIRTYFSNQKITSEQKHNFKQFIESQTEVRASPGLQSFFYRYPDYFYISDNYFVDYDTESFLTMLKLVAPVKIRKTVTLIRDK